MGNPLLKKITIFIKYMYSSYQKIGLTHPLPPANKNYLELRLPPPLKWSGRRSPQEAGHFSIKEKVSTRTFLSLFPYTTMLVLHIINGRVCIKYIM